MNVFRIVRARSAKQSDIILRLLLLQVCICILKKAPYDHQDDKSNRKSSYNGNRLKTAHGVSEKIRAIGKSIRVTAQNSFTFLSGSLSASRER